MGTPVRRPVGASVREQVGGVPGRAGDLSSVVAAGVVATPDTTVAASDRLLPVHPSLTGLLPEGGLVRGRTLACSGRAAPTAALRLVAEATASGSWLALVGVPWVGAEAARDLGVALERVVAVRFGADRCAGGRRDDGSWAECVAAAADGMDLVIAAPPPDSRAWRQVATRVRARGAVLLVLADPPSFRGATDVSVPDVIVTADPDGPGGAGWEGIGWGHGHLAARRIRVVASGRRVVRPRTVVIAVPAGAADGVPAGAAGAADGVAVVGPVGVAGR